MSGMEREGRTLPKLKGADSITNRMVTWPYTKEQKDVLREALEQKMPKEEILKFFYPDKLSEEMKEMCQNFWKQNK